MTGHMNRQKVNQPETAFVFRRIESKYMIPKDSYKKFRERLEQHMQLDLYGLSTICNIYYDTKAYDLISRSLDKPAYKEKLRLRSYGIPTKDSVVYVELKKKVGGIVYKRRVGMTLREAEAFLNEGKKPENENQITRELEYFLSFYHPSPVVVLNYDREAFYGKEDPALRMTIDRNIRYREEDFDLTHQDEEKFLRQNGDYLLEIKVTSAMPIWLAELFSEFKIYPVSFSKYGMIYSLEHSTAAVACAAYADIKYKESLPSADGAGKHIENGLLSGTSLTAGKKERGRAVCSQA